MVWVSLTGLISCLGLLLSSLSIIPVILILQSQTKHAALLPFIPALKESLETQYERERISQSTLQYLQTCLDLARDNAIYISSTVLVFGTVNMAVDFFLLIGSCCRTRLLMLPWLLVKMLELILLGGPLVIVTFLLAVHFTLGGHLMVSLLITSLPPLITILLMCVWCVVLGVYVKLGESSLSRGREVVCVEGEVVREVVRPGQVRHSQYTQFYKPRHSHARPHQPTGVNLYPTLPLPVS